MDIRQLLSPAHVGAKDSRSRIVATALAATLVGLLPSHPAWSENTTTLSDEFELPSSASCLDPAVYIGLCCGKCGGNMPLNIPGGGVPETHEWRLKLNSTYMHMPGLRSGDQSLATNDALDTYMMVPTSMDMTMTNASIGYSLGDDFFAGMMVMYMTKDMPMLTRDAKRSSMKSQGFGDTMVMTKYRLWADDPMIPTHQYSTLIGMSIPTGKISIEDDSVNLPYSMQMGSGTADPILGLLYQRSSTPWWWGINVIDTLRLYDNSRGYHLGDELRYDAYAMFQLTYDLVAEVQLNGRHNGHIRGQRDDIKQGVGHVMNDPTKPFMSPLFDGDNSGGDTLRVTAGLQWQPFPLHILNLQVSRPIFQDLDGPQMEEGLAVMLSWYVEIPTRASRRGGARATGLEALGF